MLHLFQLQTLCAGYIVFLLVVSNQRCVANTIDVIGGGSKSLNASLTDAAAPSDDEENSKHKRQALEEAAAHVAQPSILSAFASSLGEQQPDSSTLDQQQPDSAVRQERVEGGCQYVFNVPTELRCAKADSSSGELEFILREHRTRLDAQSERLGAVEEALSVARDPHRQELDRYQQDGSNDGSETSSLLESLSQQVQAQLGEMARQIAVAERRRAFLVAENRNLSAEVVDKRRAEETATRQQRELEANLTRALGALKIAQNANAAMKDQQRALAGRNRALASGNRKLGRRVMTLQHDMERAVQRRKQLLSEVARHGEARRRCTERLVNASKNVREMTDFVAILQAQTDSSSDSNINPNTTDLEHRRRPCNGTSPSVGAQAEGVERSESAGTRRCGKLVNISKPIVLSTADMPKGLGGVWMKDPLSTTQMDKIWSIKVHVLDREPPVVHGRKLEQFADVDSFCKNRPERTHLLPVPMESTGAVVYNGSLYYQRRNSRRIVRYDIAREIVVKERPIKHAGFHGMAAYLWGGYSDIDFAVDETGLWAIYSNPSNRGRIIVAKINPVTLRSTQVIRTKIQKQRVANAFIICEVLYTLSSYDSEDATINYMFDLKTGKESRLSIPFINNFRYNVMTDYNPADRRLHVWNHSNRVAYDVTLDDSPNERSTGDISPSSPDSSES